MPTRSSKDHDFATVARRVVEQAIGEHLDGTPLEEPDAREESSGSRIGKAGGSKGGRARADKLSPAKRKSIGQESCRRPLE